MLIIRADDGESYQNELSLIDVERTRPSLKAYLSEVTGFEESTILCFLSDGSQLRNENLRELAGVEDQTIYVFNREYLDLPVDQILADLVAEPQLQPEVDAKAHSASPALLLSAYSRAANFHYQHLVHRAASMAAQCAALEVAFRNLETHVLSLTSAYDVFVTTAQRDLEKQDEVLRGHATDMEIIGRVVVHRDFLSPSIRRAVENGGPERRLGDYINAHKMQQVADTSARLHEDLVQRFNHAQAQIHELITGSDEVRAGTVNPFATDIEVLLRRAKDISDQITEASLDAAIEDIQELDALLREEVQLMADYKNQLTAHCVHLVRQVSRLQSILADLPSELAQLEADLRAKAGFPHLQRLHNMLYFYGATIVEVVRRKEFAKLFTERAQTLAEMMAKLTANERKRRQVYRSEVHKQLPFDPKGMDDPAPALEINTTGTQEPPFSITRNDLIDFLRVVDEISETVAVPDYGDHLQSESQSAFIHPAREVRLTLDKLISRIDSLESDFDKLAEKSILSASWSANLSRRKNSNEVAESAYREAIEQLRGKADQEKQLLEDRDGLASEIRRLTSELHAARGEKEATTVKADELSEKVASLEEDLQTLRDQLVSESNARRSLEQRHSDSLAETVKLARQLDEALAEATEQTRDAEKRKCELDAAKDETARIREMHEASDLRIATLLEEQANTLRRIEEAQAHGENLEARLRAAVEGGEEASKALKAAAAENERILKDRASEADRVLRDQVAEADGDRAVLEHQLAEARNQASQRLQEISELKVELEIRRADQVRVEEDIGALERQKNEQELTLKHQVDSLKREVDEGRSAIIELRRRMVAQERTTSEIIKVATKMRDVNAKTMTNAQKYILGPKHSSNNAAAAGSSSTGADDFSAASLIMSATSNTLGTSQFPSSSSFPPSSSSAVHAAFSPQTNGHGQLPVDPSSPQEALSVLSAFDLEAFTDTMNKTGSTIRKWQKQCKEYRERARGKIAYRNFQKGDLALFLPTRNAETRPWAAFNVSFPHYFLQVEGHLRDQLQNREWVVARIASITERVVDRSIPDSNPYKLGEGVKYFMLEVEDWTKPAQQSSTSPQSPDSSRSAPQRSHSLTGSVAPTRSSPSSGTRTKVLGRSVSDGGTLQGHRNGVDRGVAEAGKSGPGEARGAPSAGIPPILEKNPDVREEESSKGLPMVSVGNRASTTAKDASSSSPSSPQATIRPSSLLSTSLRQPLPRAFSPDSEDEEDRPQTLRHSFHGLARSPPGPFVPLLDPIVQGQRAPSPKRTTPNTAGFTANLAPSTPTTPTAEVSKVFVEGGTSPRPDKGKGKELPISTPATSSTASAQQSPRGGRIDLLPSTGKQNKSQQVLSSSPLRVSRLAGDSPSPSSSSTRSRPRTAAATPLAVPFSGRPQSGLAGTKRPLSVGMPGGFDQATVSTSPPSSNSPFTRDMNASISNMSKARASVAVTSEMDSGLVKSTSSQLRSSGLSTVSENEASSNNESSTRSGENVSPGSGGSSNLLGMNGGQGQRVETREAGGGGGGGTSVSTRNVGGNANTQTERRRTTSVMSTASGGWLSGWGATFGRRSTPTPSRGATSSNAGGADAEGVAANLLKRFNEGS